MKVDVADRAVTLVDNDKVFDGNPPKFKNCEVLLTSKGDIATALKKFIENQP